MKQIKLTKGRVALVDDRDFSWLNQWKWCISNGYAARSIYMGGGRKNPKNKVIYIHRLVNKTLDGFETDHINRNKLDNRRCNLRTADRSLNTRNHPLRISSKSGYKGIDFYKRVKKWRVRISINKKTISLGYFGNIKDAVKARKQGEELYWNT